MMDLRTAQETAAAANRQVETRRHQEEWMWSGMVCQFCKVDVVWILSFCNSFSDYEHLGGKR